MTSCSRILLYICCKEQTKCYFNEYYSFYKVLYSYIHKNWVNIIKKNLYIPAYKIICFYYNQQNVLNLPTQIYFVMKMALESLTKLMYVQLVSKYFVAYYKLKIL